MNFGVIYKGISFLECVSLTRNKENRRHLVSTRTDQFLLRVWTFPVVCSWTDGLEGYNFQGPLDTTYKDDPKTFSMLSKIEV